MTICYTASYQIPVFVSILPRSLQKIAPEKNHELHSNELAKGYTLIPMPVLIDKYRRAEFQIKQDSTVKTGFALDSCLNYSLPNFGSILPISLQKNRL